MRGSQNKGRKLIEYRDPAEGVPEGGEMFPAPTRPPHSGILLKGSGTERQV